MVRIPVFSGHGTDRTEADQASADTNRDGVVDEREERLAEQRRASARQQIDERAVHTARGTAPAVAGTALADRPMVADGTDVAELPGPRARASLRATIGLILGVVSLLAVFSGVLAAAGVALGIIAAVIAATGLASTGRRYVAGKADAMLGLVLGLGAVAIGVLALSGSLPWLNPDTDQVVRLRDWLYDAIPWLDRF